MRSPTAGQTGAGASKVSSERCIHRSLRRPVRFEGRLHDNPYLRSVGLEGGLLDDRLRTVPGVGLRRVGDLVELDWRYPGLLGWAHHTLEHAS